MIQCKLCNKEFKMITNSHLRIKHGITTEEYLARFPSASLCDEEMKDHYSKTRMKLKPSDFSVCAHPECKERVNHRNSKYCSYSCAMSHRMSKEWRNEQSASSNPQYTNGNYWLRKSQKQKAKERDGFECQSCGLVSKGKKIHAHHLIPETCFDTAEEAHALKNIVTLCNVCHKTAEVAILRELYQRALRLDRLLKDDPTHIPIRKYKDMYIPEVKSRCEEQRKKVR